MSIFFSYEGEAPPSTLVIDPPIAPQSYTVPGGATLVSNATQLQTELSTTTAKNIILANGTYDKSAPFTVGAAHRVWAATLGGATLTAAINFNNSGAGPEVHGVRFNVTSSAKATNTRRNGACLYFAGSAHGGKVEDCWFSSDRNVGVGIDFIAFNGAEIHRVVIDGFLANGIMVNNWPTSTIANPPTWITDCDISNIQHTSSQNGTSEFGINSGTTGLYERIRCRNCRWSGIVPNVVCNNSTFRHIHITGSTASAAFYFEHDCPNTILENFYVENTNTTAAINFESAQERWNCRSCGDGQIVRNGTVVSPKLGANVSWCNANVLIENVKFIGQCACAIAHPSGSQNSPEGCCGFITTNVFQNNDYSEIGPDAVPILERAWNQIPSC